MISGGLQEALERLDKIDEVEQNQIGYVKLPPATGIELTDPKIREKAKLDAIRVAIHEIGEELKKINQILKRG